MTGRFRAVLAIEVAAAIALISVSFVSVERPQPGVWLTFALLSSAAAVSVVFSQKVPGQIVCSPLVVFVTAAALSLPAFLILPFLMAPHLVDWLVRRPAWSKRLNNAANQSIAALSAYYVSRGIGAPLGGGMFALIACATGAIVLVGLNTSLISAVWAAHQNMRKAFAPADRETIEGSLLSACLGVACAVIMHDALWATPFVFASVVALPRAFSLPLLRRDGVERQRELEREQAVGERLRELDRLKREFVAMVSHELRTPIASIAGYTEMILEDEEQLSSEHFQQIAIVKKNAGRLTRLVDDLALMDEVESESSVQFAIVDLRTVVGEALASARPRAIEKDIELEFIASGDLTVSGDFGRLGQVADNLISNAIKYTPSGGTVEVRSAQAGQFVTLEVRDNGPGISAEDQQHLFDRFFRTAEAKKGSVPGSGLGLAIVKAIIDQHGGSRPTSELYLLAQPKQALLGRTCLLFPGCRQRSWNQRSVA